MLSKIFQCIQEGQLNKKVKVDVVVQLACSRQTHLCSNYTLTFLFCIASSSHRTSSALYSTFTSYVPRHMFYASSFMAFKYIGIVVPTASRSVGQYILRNYFFNQIFHIKNFAVRQLKVKKHLNFNFMPCLGKFGRRTLK